MAGSHIGEGKGTVGNSSLKADIGARSAKRAGVTGAQHSHVLAIVQRLDLSIPEGCLTKLNWVRNFLDVFSYDPNLDAGGYRSLRTLLVRYAEGVRFDHIGNILGVTASAVEQAIEVLDASGYKISNFDSDDLADIDPEIFSLAFQEWKAEDPDVRRPRPPYVRNRNIFFKLLDDPQALDGDEIVPPGKTPRRRGEPSMIVRQSPKLPRTAHGLKAFRFLEGSDYGMRLKWSRRAGDAGITMPPAATARENIHHWVDGVAQQIIIEERLIRGLGA